MRGKLLPAARNISAQANVQLAGASGRATGLPLALVLLVAAVIVGFALYRAQRRPYQRTRLRLNPGLVVASVAGRSRRRGWSSRWAWPVPTCCRRARTDPPREPALAQADTAALQARADESLTLIDAQGDDNFQQDFVAVQYAGPGPAPCLRKRDHGRPRQPGGLAAAAASAAATWSACTA